MDIMTLTPDLCCVCDHSGVLHGVFCIPAVDKCISQSMSDARDAMINAAIDVLNSYGQTLTSSQRMGQVPVLFSFRLIPLYILALLKYVSLSDARF